MSHIVEAKTQIVCPDLPTFRELHALDGSFAVASHPFIALLRQAVTVIATEYGGTVESFYLDYYRNRQPVNTGLALHIPRRSDHPQAPALVRGLGLTIDETTGVLSFVGDPYRVEAFSKQIQWRIVQTYVGLAFMASLRTLQYQTSSQMVEECLVVSGVQHE